MLKALAIVVAAAIAAGCAGSGAAGVRSTASADWTRFGYDASRSSDDPNSTGITAANVASLVRHQVQLPGTVDSSAIYLKGVDGQRRVARHALRHDDVRDHARDRRPQPLDPLAVQAAELRVASPAARRSRRRRRSPIRAASGSTPRRRTGRSRSSRSPTATPPGASRSRSYATHEKIAVLAQLRERPRDRDDRRLHRRRAAVPGARRDHLAGRHPPPRLELALLEPARAHRPVVVPGERLGDLGTRRRGRHAGQRQSPRRDGERASGTGTTNWGDAVIELSPKATMLGNYTPTNTAELNATDTDIGSTSPVYLTSKLIAQGGKDGKIRLLSLARLHGTVAAQGPRAPDRLDAVGHRPLHRAGGVAPERAHAGSSPPTAARRRRGSCGTAASIPSGSTETPARARSSREGSSTSTTRAAGSTSTSPRAGSS